MVFISSFFLWHEKKKPCRQDALDLFLGERKVAIIEPVKFEGKKQEVLLQSKLWYVTLLVAILRLLAPRQVHSNFQFLQAAFWSAFMVVAWTIFNLDGRVLTSHPTKPDEVDIPRALQRERKKKIQ